MRIMRIHFQEFVDKRAIIHHRLPHFFRVGFSALPPQRERASGPIVLNDYWMIHGQVGRTPVEVFKRVATSGHHLRDKLIRFADSAMRIVNEPRLDATPFAGKCARLIVSELVQVEATDAFGALTQHGVRAFGTNSLNGSFVLRSEPFAQADPLPTTDVGPRRKREQQDNNTNPDNHEGL